MKITPCKFTYYTAPDSAVNLIPRLDPAGYSGPIELPKPVHLFGNDYRFISIGHYGQILLGGWRLEVKNIPTSLSEIREGYLLMPFGEPQVMKACGTRAVMWLHNDIVILDFNVKDLTKKHRYRYQVQIPLREPNKAIFAYQFVTTGLNTIVGAVASPGNFIEWGEMEEEQQYHNVALCCDTMAEDVVPVPEPQPDPVDPTPEPEPVDPTHDPLPSGKWVTVYQDDTAWLQVKK